jgi:general secretion pathway protein G
MIKHEYSKARFGRKRNCYAIAITASNHGEVIVGKRGFTLVELLAVVAIMAILVIIAMPAYSNFREMAKIARAKSEISSMGGQIALYVIDKGSNPLKLDDLPSHAINDPWGHPYHYYNIVTNTPAGETQYMDIGGVDVLNHDYDLYSSGKDGITAIPHILSAPEGADDVVRVNDGSSVELGSRRGE